MTDGRKERKDRIDWRQEKYKQIKTGNKKKRVEMKSSRKQNVFSQTNLKRLGLGSLYQILYNFVVKLLFLRHI
jgi:hypothetical protein